MQQVEVGICYSTPSSNIHPLLSSLSMVAHEVTRLRGIQFNMFCNPESRAISIMGCAVE